MENYNRQLCNSLDKFTSNCMNQGFDLRESTIHYSNILYALETTEDPFEKLYREYIISVMYVVGFIQNLTNYDQNNAEKLLIEIAKKDYSASKYLNSLSNECDIFKEHIDLYEKYSKNDILFTFMEESSTLKDALYHITYVYALKEYNNLSINIEEIEDCNDTEVMRKLIVK